MAIASIVFPLFNNLRANALIDLFGKKKPIKLTIVADLEAKYVTSRSAEIYVEGHVVNKDKIGRKNILFLVMLIQGQSGKYIFSVPSSQPVLGRYFNYKVVLSRENLRNKITGEPLELIPDTEYMVTLNYAIVDSKGGVIAFDMKDVVAAMTFTTKPDKKSEKK